MIKKYIKSFKPPPPPLSLLCEFSKLTCGLVDVIYGSPDGTLMNRGFCFLEYNTHKAAAVAKRYLEKGRTKLWGCDIVVDWADPQEEPDEEAMSTVKILYVKHLTEEVTDYDLKKLFEKYGKLERVKKMKDYAFIHFEKRDNALIAMGELNGKQLRSTFIKVSLTTPPPDKKKTEEILHARERRMYRFGHTTALCDWCHSHAVRRGPAVGLCGNKGPSTGTESFASFGK